MLRQGDGVTKVFFAETFKTVIFHAEASYLYLEINSSASSGSELLPEDTLDHYFTIGDVKTYFLQDGEWAPTSSKASSGVPMIPTGISALTKTQTTWKRSRKTTIMGIISSSRWIAYLTNTNRIIPSPGTSLLRKDDRLPCGACLSVCVVFYKKRRLTKRSNGAEYRQVFSVEEKRQVLQKNDIVALRGVPFC